MNEKTESPLLEATKNISGFWIWDRRIFSIENWFDATKNVDNRHFLILTFNKFEDYEVRMP